MIKKFIEEADAKSWTRTIVFFIALVNQGLAIFGKSPIPLNEENLELFISFVLSAVTAVWTWWKNNYVGPKGKSQKASLETVRLD